MHNLPPNFLVEKEEKVIFLIKHFFPENFIFNNHMPYFPKVFKGIVMRSEENFYKMKRKVNTQR